MSRHRTLIRLSAVLVAVALAKGCGDGDSPTAPPTPEPARPTTVTVSPATTGLTALGATVQLAAEVRDQNASVMAGVTITWTSSADGVATVDAAGLVTAAGNGAATITASAGSASGSAAVTVTQSVVSVDVSPSATELTALGATVQLTAEAFDENGHAVAGAEFSWESSDAAVATVDTSGLVTAVAEGVATITASAGSASGSAVVTVMQPVASVEVSPSEETVGLGSTLQLTAEGFDENGDAVEGAEFSWESNDAAIATVDAGGLVTGVAVGVATITASAGSGQGTAEITVMDLARAALIALYEATDGPNWVNSENWLTDAPLGEWYGVDTDADGRVVELDLRGTFDDEAGEWVSHGLSGPIPTELGNLANLTELRLYANDLTGPIPTELGGLVNLELLYLYENALTGPIPTELGSLANLTRLSLRDNNLTGPIPTELGNLANLTRLRLYANDLTGPIPTELGGLVNLELLYLYENALTGPIPTELGSLANLTRLSLRDNNLTGPIPTELGNLANLESLNFWGNALSGPIPTELGSLANLEWLDLGYNGLSGPIPPELSNLANLTGLHLGDNSLNGPIPTELGSLANLEWLSLDGNSLSGPIPQSFLQLDRLSGFYIRGNESLCVPGTSAFVGWLRGIEDWDESESLCNAADVAALKLLYETTGGTAWTESDGWSGDGAVEDWHGVATDSLGRVTELDLTRNGLAGQLPPNLGDLARMTELRIAGNPDLSGRLPLSLDRLALRTLHYAGTGLCAPVYTSFRDWLGAIPSHEGTDAECAPLSDREVLEALYDATGGLDWTHNENWLTDAPLADWHGVKVDDSGRVVALALGANDVKGRIPREIGGLANLEWLDLYRNGLKGSIPPELGELANLEGLILGENGLTGTIPRELGELTNLFGLILNENDLTGPIPAELADLSNLFEVNLNYNRLTGPIPPTLGGLASLEELALGGNELTGPIPSELGDLVNLRKLNLAANRLTGTVPPELGSLAELESLYLGENELRGPVPPEFSGLMRLRNLAVQANTDMSGVLPVGLTNLAALETFQTTGTALCAPSDAGFLEWLEGVPNRRVALCEGEPAAAYLVQAVQSREFPVSLVAGEEALLRVFVTAGSDNDERLPPVRASFHLNGALAHVAEIPGRPGPIPTEVDEGSLATSANGVVPADVVLPGLEMVVEVDPDETLDPALGVATRIPATGRAAVDVRAMPLFDLTLVPFLWTKDPDSEVVESVRGMAADPEGHELLELTRTLLPVGALDVKAHEPVMSSSNNAYDLIDQTGAIRVMEGGTGYYMGTMSGSVTGAGGLGGGLASFAVPSAFVIAHEFGHNFSLPHAPCGGAAGPDPAYPTPDGTIGVWGYDFKAGRLVPPSRFDLMTYCDPAWVSDYFFTKALHFRLFEERPPLVAILTAQESASLLLWGGADGDGEPYLNPTFVVDAPPVLPDAAGDYRITGRTPTGDELFSLDFAMPETADGDGSSSFAFVLPVDFNWIGNLASITLSGPGGSATLDGDTDLPMTILLDPVTGHVRAMLRDVPQADAAAALAPQAGPDSLEVLFSRGIPDATAWRR